MLAPLMDGSAVKGYWHVQIVDGAGEVLWDEEVWITGLAIDLFSGMAGYVYLHTSARVKTTYSDGRVVETSGSAVKGTWVTLPETPTWGLGSFGLWGEWISDLYDCYLPAGARFRIVRHTVGLVNLRPRTASIQTRLQTAGGLAVLRSPEHGMVWVARIVGGGLEVIGTVDLRAVARNSSGLAWSPAAGPCPAPIRSVLPVVGASRPVLVRLGCRTHLVLVYQAGGGIWLSESWTNGQETSWGAWSEPMRLASNCSLLAAAAAPDGGALYLVVKRGDVVCRARCPREFVDGQAVYREATPEPMQLADGDGFPNVPDQLHHLFLQGGNAIFVADAGQAVDAYVSDDDLRTWRD